MHKITLMWTWVAITKTSTTGLNNTLNTYRGKDFTNGRLNLKLCGSTVHVPTNHVGHWLNPWRQDKRSDKKERGVTIDTLRTNKLINVMENRHRKTTDGKRTVLFLSFDTCDTLNNTEISRKLPLPPSRVKERHLWNELCKSVSKSADVCKVHKVLVDYLMLIILSKFASCILSNKCYIYKSL